jgi:hypothetical protein
MTLGINIIKEMGQRFWRNGDWKCVIKKNLECSNAQSELTKGWKHEIRSHTWYG